MLKLVLILRKYGLIHLKLGRLNNQIDRYINQIFEEIEYISIKPENGKDFSYVRKNYLRTKVKYHFIFYKVSKKTSIVEIIRILHQQMDIENRLT